MRYAQIRKMDISNGKGLGISLFVQGCSRHCRNCFNPETWDFNGGKLYTSETKNTILKLLNNEHIKRISILGGEPMEEVNVTSVSDLIDSVRWVYGDTKSIWLYTGYTFEELVTKDKEVYRNILNKIDCLVDGAYIDELKDMSLQYRGSSNQRIIKIVR